MAFLKSIFGRSNEPDQTHAILRRHLDGDFRIFPMAETPTTSAQIEAIGVKFGVKYPSELVAHICGQFPGIYVEVKEEIWPRPKELDVAPFWSFLYAVHSYTSAPESEPWMRLDAAAESFQEQTGLKAAPILAVVGDADVYCATPSGALARFRHETEELEPVVFGFWQLFEQEVAALKERKMRKLAGT